MIVSAQVLSWTVSVVNWWPSSVISLSHRPSTYVYSTVGTWHCDTRVCQRQRRLVVRKLSAPTLLISDRFSSATAVNKEFRCCGNMSSYRPRPTHKNSFTVTAPQLPETIYLPLHETLIILFHSRTRSQSRTFHKHQLRKCWTWANSSRSRIIHPPGITSRRRMDYILPLWFFFFFRFSTPNLRGQLTDFNQTWTHIHLWLPFDKFGPNFPGYLPPRVGGKYPGNTKIQKRAFWTDFELWWNISLQRNMTSTIGKNLPIYRDSPTAPPNLVNGWRVFVHFPKFSHWETLPALPHGCYIIDSRQTLARVCCGTSLQSRTTDCRAGSCRSLPYSYFWQFTGWSKFSADLCLAVFFGFCLTWRIFGWYSADIRLNYG